MEKSLYVKNKQKARGDIVTVAVALSGGVDSAVAAALLKKQGYRVIAFFMKNWSEIFGLKDSECPWVQDRKDAMAVAAAIDIPFHTLDFEKEYKREVLDYFFREYQAGRTPNPDIICNSRIKFGAFLDKAMELGADYIATGHYARLKREVISKKEKVKSNLLMRAIDKNKDQTYFLYRLTQSQLSKAMFPIGEYAKPQVRCLAKKLGLPNWDKPDSQGVCFMGHIDLRKFLSQRIKDNPGDIILVSEGAENFQPVRKIGEHRGLFWYTIGQRQGIGIGGVGPFYVVEKDLKNNRLIVTQNPRHQRLYKSVVEFNETNWINPFLVETPRRASRNCTGRIRYREPLVKCRIEKINNAVYGAVFAEPVWAPAAGQSIVFYKGDICLGGGIIK